MGGAAPPSFPSLLSARALESAGQEVFSFLEEGERPSGSLGYGRLDLRARAVAAALRESCAPGDLALLLYPQGLEFIVAFAGCLYAGLIAVPVPPPDEARPARTLGRLRAVAADARPAAVLTTPALLAARERLTAGTGLADCRWIATEEVPDDLASAWRDPGTRPEDPAYLQYTSGSTATPKGVVVTHGNLLHNSVLIRDAWGYAGDSVAVMWVPHFHDDGLVHGIVQPLFTGFRSVLLPPAAVVQRPVRWLRAITRFRGTHAGGPNFIYALCSRKVDPAQREELDLSSWRMAYNAAEPVRAETLERFARAFEPCGFRRSAFYPSFGLAESTLLVSTASGDGPQVLRVEAAALEQGRVVPAAAGGTAIVGCGRAVSETRIAVVHPQERSLCRPDEVGEVWISSPSVAAGYWQRQEETRETFGAVISGSDGGDGPFLRTGDLGFLRDGELFITGRMKDLIIVRGRNLYPQDVELTAEEAHPACRPGCGAAFSLEVSGEERLALVQEVEPAQAGDPDALVAGVCQAVLDAHDVQLHTLVLVAPRSIPKTSSGKIQRRACRAALLAGELDALHEWSLGEVPAPALAASAGADGGERVAGLLDWLRGYAREQLDSRLMDEHRSISPSVVLDFASHGLLGLQAATEHGGLGLCTRDALRAVEQLGAIDLTLATFVIGHNALGSRPVERWAAPALRARLLPELAVGRHLAAFALTETGAGSNPRAIATLARPDGRGGWTLHGTKIWSGSAAWAGTIAVFAQALDEAGRPIGITAFAVPQGSPGLVCGPEALTLGLRGMSQCEVHLDGVPVGPEHLLGAVGQGLEVARDAMERTRLWLGAASVGAMKRCAQLMLRYAHRRQIGTGRLLDNPVTLARLGELTAATRAVEALVDRLAAALDRGLALSSEVTACCKVVSTELLWQAADSLVQLLGGRGYIETNVAPQILRDARVFRIFEGPTETLLLHVGSSLAAGSPDLDRFLRGELAAPGLADSLREAAGEIAGRLARSPGRLTDRVAVLRWGHALVGDVAARALLAAACEDRRAAEWARQRFAEARTRALAGAAESSLLQAEEAEELIGRLEAEIGDVEQRLTGEDGLDPLLRREEVFTPVPADPSLAVPSDHATNELRSWLVAWLAREAEIDPARIDVRRPFAVLGMDSVTAVRMADELGDHLGRPVDSTLAWRYPTIDALARHLAGDGTPDIAAVLREEAPRSGRSALERVPALSASEPVAIVGIGCRFPGARGPEAFWGLLRDGVDAVSEVPPERWSLDEHFDPDPSVPGRTSSRWGGFLDGIDLFDAPFFAVAPREAAGIDPQHRLLLEVAWEALEDAAVDPARLAGSRAGVFVGIFMDDYRRLRLGDPESIDAFAASGTVFSLAANRISFTLDLHGPSLALDTACSSSLVAVHLACQSLRSGESTLALAGGVNLLLTPGPTIEMTKAGLLAADGRCKAFDERADGYVRGEGAGLVVLKPLARALADGDRIYAVLRGSAVNQDGRTNGLTAPSPQAQEAVVREACRRAGVSPARLQYVEAHGSGTSVGDAIEAAALGAVLASGRPAGQDCLVGSVKTNIGHVETAAGVAGLIKVALALQHREVPPSIHFEKPNPRIPFGELRLRVAAAREPWPETDGPAYAGVSSFGFGGTNAHAVLEAAPAAADSGPSRPWQLLTLSARTAAALDRTTAELAERVRGLATALDVADAAFTLRTGRTAFEHRRAVVCRRPEDAAAALAGLDPRAVFTQLAGRTAGSERPVAFLLPGLGEHYEDMTLGLYRGEPRFREEVDRCAELLRPHLGEDVREALYPGLQDGAPAAEERRSGPDLRRLLGRAPAAAPSRLDRTEIAQPAVFTVEYALAQLLAEWGIRPSAVIGYSLGEYTAACLAGIFPLPEALALVAARARLIGGLPAGAMLAVPLPEEELAPLLTPLGLSLAAVNGPALCVAAGPTEAIAELQRSLAGRGVATSPLRTSHAFHSSMMEPVAGELATRMRALSPAAPRVPLVANVTGRWMTAEEAADPGFWTRHLCGPVRFGQGLEALLSERPDLLLLEVGPGAALTSFVRQHPRTESGTAAFWTVPNAFDRQDDQAFLLGAVGRLWVSGGPLDGAGLYARERRRRVALPTYPFEGRRYWLDGKPEAAPKPAARRGRTDGVDGWFYVPRWRQSPPLPAAGSATGIWLIFTEAGGLGDRLARRLEEQSAEVVRVRPGARYARRSESEVEIDPRSPRDYAALLDGLEALPSRIVHLWSVGREGAVFEETQDLGFYSLVHLVQALSRHGAGAPVEIAAVTSHLQRVTGAEPLQPEKATVLGACRVIPQEYLHMTCRSIDVDLPEPGWREERLAERLAAELAAPAKDLTVALRRGERWVEVFEPVRLEAPPSASRLRPRGVYLITGGLGGVGSALAEHLARAVSARLVLTGRSELPPREVWGERLAAGDPAGERIRRVLRLEEMGAEVEIVAADVADEAAMRAAVARCRSRFGALHGVIHAAGVVGPSALRNVQELGRGEAEQHFRSKVRGTLVLEEVLAGLDLDFVLLCSSISTVLGGLGFCAYAAANLFLDAVAERRTEIDSTPWTSVAWDTWNLDGQEGRAGGGGGFGATVADLEMTAEEGIEAFRRIVAAWPWPRLVISTGDLEARIDQWVRLSAVRGAPDKTGPRPGRHARPELPTPYAAPATELERTLCGMWEELMGLDRVGIHDSFFELGGHSLLATQLAARLRERLQIDLPVRSLFDTPTPAGLGRALETLLWMAQGDDGLALVAGGLVEGEL